MSNDIDSPERAVVAKCRLRIAHSLVVVLRTIRRCDARPCDAPARVRVLLFEEPMSDRRVLIIESDLNFRAMLVHAASVGVIRRPRRRCRPWPCWIPPGNRALSRRALSQEGVAGSNLSGRAKPGRDPLFSRKRVAA